jgi:hypothetical protein
MITTDKLDVAKIEAAEDTLELAVRSIEDAASIVRYLAGDESQLAQLAQLPGILDDEFQLINELAGVLTDFVDELHGALDCLQMGLRRPYVWLLNRTPL